MSDQNQTGPNFEPINEQRHPYEGHPYPGHVPPGQVPGGPPPKPTKRKRFGFLAITITAALGLAVGGAVGGAGKGASTTAEPASVITVTAEPKPGAEKTVTAEPKADEKPAEKKEQEAPPVQLGDGLWEVGVDLPAGRYKTVVPSDSINCYVARHKDDSGELESIIANNNYDADERVSVKVKKGEWLELSGCGSDWQRVG